MIYKFLTKRREGFLYRNETIEKSKKKKKKKEKIENLQSNLFKLFSA